MPEKLPTLSPDLDFADRGVTDDPALDHPDVDSDSIQPSHLSRNKSERRRKQGLQHAISTASRTKSQPQLELTWRQKYDRWMINEGGRRLFFGVWVLLHVLVSVLGFINYELKDNYVTARATFGVTFGPSHLSL